MAVKSSINVLLLSMALGGEVMYSYVVAPICFKHMPREEFGSLQSKIFPIYFLGQAAMPVLIGITSPLSLGFTTSLLGMSAAAGALNSFWVLPAAHDIRDQRKKLVAEKAHEQVVDGQVQASEEMKKLNKQFGTYHGISSALNLVSVVTLGIYGFALGGRIA